MTSTLKRMASSVIEEVDSKKPKLRMFKAEFAPNQFVCLSYLRGVLYIHIRHFIKTENGSLVPSIVGAVFNEKRYAAFCSMRNELDERYDLYCRGHYVTPYETFIGGGWKVTVHDQSSQIDIRKCYRTKGGLVRPSKKGIIINMFDYGNLAKCLNQLNDMEPHLLSVTPCYMDHTPEDLLECRECTPFRVAEPAGVITRSTETDETLPTEPDAEAGLPEAVKDETPRAIPTLIHTLAPPGSDIPIFYTPTYDPGY